MIENFYKDNELYLKFLGIEQTSLPVKNDQLNLQDFYKLVENSFRILVRKYHPDFGGDSKKFLFLLDCKSKLLESNTHAQGFNLKINKYDEKFEKNAINAELGTQIFELISSWSEELCLKPIFKPSQELDDYEWIFKIINTDLQLSLNVQALSNDLAELFDQLYKNDSLNVLVCLFIPSKKLMTIKNKHNNSTTLKFNDLILLESSNAKDLQSYFSSMDNIMLDLENIKNGTFQSRESELKTLLPSEAINQDQMLFNSLTNLKLFSTEYNSQAADFIDKI